MWGGVLVLILLVGSVSSRSQVWASFPVGGVGEGAGVLVLRFLWDVLGFERFPAWASCRGQCLCPRPLGGGALSCSLGCAPFPVGVLVLPEMPWQGVVLFVRCLS